MFYQVLNTPDVVSLKIISMVLISDVEFEQLIEKAIAELPQNIQDSLQNVVFVVEDESEGRQFLGLYHGVPATKRGTNYTMVLPDKITIYKRAIEDQAESVEELPGLVRRVVWHEIGHHLGFDEQEIQRLEKKWEMERKV